MTAKERLDLASKLHAIQAQIDELLDHIVNEPKRKAPAKISAKKTPRK
jgi:hypothetical protein